MKVALSVELYTRQRPLRAAREPLARFARQPAGLTLALVAFGVVSLLVAPSGLGDDPSAWFVWGRDLGHMRLGTAGGPAVKPLPVLVAALLSPAGHVGTYIWLALVRSSALLAVLLAFRLASRSAGRLGGFAAAATLAFSLSATLLWATLQGYAEAPAIALVLAAIDGHVAGRPRQAFVLASLAALCRPEAWPLLALYALFQWRRERPLRVLFFSLLLLIPAVWIGSDWWRSGQLFTGPAPETLPGNAASSDHPALVVLARAAFIFPLPALAGVAASVALARRRADALVHRLSVSALAWIGIVALMSEAGFAGDARYVVVPAGVLAVPAGIGIAWMVRTVRAARVRLTLLALLAVIAATYAFALVHSSVHQLANSRIYARQLSDLRVAVARAGGRARVLSPGPPAIDPHFHSALAADLKTSFPGVQRTWTASRTVADWRAPAVVFRPTEMSSTGPTLRPPGRDVEVRELARTREWSVALATPRRGSS